MKASAIVRARGLSEEIRSIMAGGEWMTSGMIASQIIWPPETARREQTNRERCSGRKVSIDGAHSGLVARVLHSMFRNGCVERKQSDNARVNCRGSLYKYRLRVK